MGVQMAPQIFGSEVPPELGWSEVPAPSMAYLTVRLPVHHKGFWSGTREAACPLLSPHRPQSGGAWPALTCAVGREPPGSVCALSSCV